MTQLETDLQPFSELGKEDNHSAVDLIHRTNIKCQSYKKNIVRNGNKTGFLSSRNLGFPGQNET